jgi:succinoglycan biosynthesis protein ExoW
MSDSLDTSVAIVIPFYQREAGVLRRTLNSVFAQSFQGMVTTIVVDDGSPVSIDEELSGVEAPAHQKLIIVKKENGGAGAARNAALEQVDPETTYVAFLDSDDEWTVEHLDNAVNALDRGYGLYFSDYWASDYRETSNFHRVGSVLPQDHPLLDEANGLHEFSSTIIDHVVRQGNVIQTSTVVYSFQEFGALRFREEFYNGQDFFFWLDLGERGARGVFSTQVECDCGQGVNIYSGSGWGSEKSLNRIRNEIKIWSSVKRIYELNEGQQLANDSRLARLRENAVRDVVHRVLNRKAMPLDVLKNIVQLDGRTIWDFPVVIWKILWGKIAG